MSSYAQSIFIYEYILKIFLFLNSIILKFHILFLNLNLISNDKWKRKKWFRKDGELVVGSSELSTKLSTLLDSETLFNGDTIHLDFET